MLTVVGEALVDLVISPDGSVEAKLGGAPFTTARACGRLGLPASFVGALSRDRFGCQLAAQLTADGVDIGAAPRVDVPTTLAAAELDQGGAATYRFYLDGTSVPALEQLAVSPGDSLFTGGLALVVEPMADLIEEAIAARGTTAALDDHSFVMVDVNCRPLVIADRDRYVERINRVVAVADVVKVSDEDLEYLSPNQDPVAAATELAMSGPAAVLLTRGGDGVDVLTADGRRRVGVEPVEVIDTIGAGDTFGAGFLAWLIERGVRRSELAALDIVTAAVEAANQVASIVVGRRGADPPWRRELPDSWSEIR